MENHEERKLIAVKDSERDGKDTLLPETKIRVLKELEEYLSECKSINISEIARQLDVKWETAEGYVREVTERWRKENIREIEKHTRKVLHMLDLESDRLITKGVSLTTADIQEYMNLLQEFNGLQKLNDGEVTDLEDSKRMINIQFNNIATDEKTAAELRKIQEEKRHA
ncbi:MAG: hypothetical protein ACYDBV_12500 [Nitrospiria bacterium]